MSIDRIDGNSGDQGPMSPWGLAAASTNDGEQQPSGVEGYSDVQDDETQELGRPMTPRRLNAIVMKLPRYVMNTWKRLLGSALRIRPRRTERVCILRKYYRLLKP